MKPNILEKFVDLCLQLAQTRALDRLLENAMDMALDLMEAECGNRAGRRRSRRLTLSPGGTIFRSPYFLDTAKNSPLAL
jgi:hypothetical protein